MQTIATSFPHWNICTSLLFSIWEWHVKYILSEWPDLAQSRSGIFYYLRHVNLHMISLSLSYRSVYFFYSFIWFSLSFLRSDWHDQFIFLEKHFFWVTFSLLPSNIYHHKFFSMKICSLDLNASAYALRGCSGKRMLIINYHILDSFKKGMIFVCQNILEIKWMSSWYSIDLYAVFWWPKWQHL